MQKSLLFLIAACFCANSYAALQTPLWWSFGSSDEFYGFYDRVNVSGDVNTREIWMLIVPKKAIEDAQQHVQQDADGKWVYQQLLEYAQAQHYQQPYKAVFDCRYDTWRAQGGDGTWGRPDAIAPGSGLADVEQFVCAKKLSVTPSAPKKATPSNTSMKL